MTVGKKKNINKNIIGVSSKYISFILLARYLRDIPEMKIKKAK